MKLVNYLTSRISVVLILILLCWSGIYFFLQMNEIYDGIDEGLTNLKQEFIYNANTSHGFVENFDTFNPLNLRIEEISEDEAIHFIESFSTSNVYFNTELEEEEVRLLTTTFYCELNKKYYKLQFFTSTVESEDLVESMLYLLLGLWITLSAAIIIVNRIYISKVNKPFYQLLNELKEFRLGKTKMITIPESKITEYTELNHSVEELLKNNIEIYLEQKNFIENASHELQTPVAIIANKLELMLNDDSLSEEQTREISSMISILSRMKKLNNSLLLLSKIRNKQYAESQEINLRNVFEEVLGNFHELIQHKQLTIEENGNRPPTLLMNPDLAFVLVNNLIKNAITHNIKNGRITINYSSQSIAIANSGNPLPDTVNIFERYVSENSSGLGLSIVKSISDLYNLKISHHYSDGKHIFTLFLI